METIQSKRVYQEFDQSDGFRVLVDRLWPRGVRKADSPYDLWAKEIAPSTELLRWYHADIEGRWSDFELHYLNELNNSMYAHEFLEQIDPHQTITLLYAEHDRIHNHAIILQKYIEQHLNPHI